MVEFMGQPWLHGKAIKRVVHHCDIHSQFMNLADLDELFYKRAGPRGSDRPRAGSDELQSVKTWLVVSHFRQHHRPSNFYTVARGGGGSGADATSHLRSFADKVLDVGLGCDATAIRDAVPEHVIVFEPDGFCDNSLADGVRASLPRVTRRDAHVLRVVDLNPSSKKLACTDRVASGHADEGDTAVVQHHICKADLPAKTIWVTPQALPIASMQGLPGESTALVADARFAEATTFVWQRDPERDLRMLDADITATMDGIDTALASKVVDMAWCMGAFPDSDVVLNPVVLEAELRAQLPAMVKWELLRETGPGKDVQLTDVGLNAVKIWLCLHKPGRIVSLCAHLPLRQRSPASLAMLLESSGWVWREFLPRKSFEFPVLPVPAPAAAIQANDKRIYVKAGNKTVSRDYLECLVLIDSDDDFRSKLHQGGASTFKYLQKGSYYMELLQLQCPAAICQDEAFEFD